MSDAASLLGASPGPFLGLTLVLFGAAALATGRALARHWRPVWQTLPYAALLGLGDRFLLYALFDGELLSASGYLIGALILLALALVAYRVTLARRMVRQYPWLYEPAGPLSWRRRS
ncbi:MAG TPA: hypothetical protein VFK49_07005 [Stellaceae bacterium]|nr:hypothetical protein [Stellaceae bacterium]